MRVEGLRAAQDDGIAVAPIDRVARRIAVMSGMRIGAPSRHGR